MKKKRAMPSYYGKNILQHAQRKFFKRKALEANQEKLRERHVTAAEQAEKK